MKAGKCPVCNSTRTNKFIQDKKLIIACEKCGFSNQREISQFYKD